MEDQRVSELEVLLSAKRNYILEIDEDLDYLKYLLNCDGSLDEVSRIYHEKTGREVIDHRDSVECIYTNVNAQSDPDFWNEESIND